MRQNVPALVAFSIAFARRAARRIGADLRHQGRHGRRCWRRRGEGRPDRAAAAAAAGRPARERRRHRPVSRRLPAAVAALRAAGRLPARRVRRRPRCSISGSSSAASRLVGNSGVLLGWTVATALASSVLIVWITLVNFFYLLTQMVMAIEDIGVRAGDAAGGALRAQQLPRDRRHLRRRPAAGGRSRPSRRSSRPPASG